ncbi:hypothetical protein L5515_003301 [Caenorhabditis briggsae]|uniref:Enhancer of polycomb-like protein n=2 Tax=Caenorhabditis briggsae TaxID=6238 RepID=A0AAE9JAN8_CAEBR|nr:hypothetical protein L5515_003301 [Caenorhabditis briggsae]
MRRGGVACLFVFAATWPAGGKMATASKAFRARAFDSNRSMTVYWGHELPDLSECSVGNRAVTQMPSGMEKEEEMESHLQDAILAQQASTSGVQVNHVIPTPKVDRVGDDRYHSTYHNRNQKRRDKYIKVHAWQALERDEPEYDYDTEDEEWLRDHQHIEPRILEKVFDTVENHSSETVVASEESVINFHKTLDSSIVYEVYEYWVNKRLTAASTSGCVGVGGLIPRVRTECRKDGQGAVNPYVAFRRRAEKMQTRKNRKNDEDSYEKILKLMHDMSKAQQLFDMTARREKQKLALLDVESELLTKRMELSDFGATSVFGEITEKLRATSETSKPEQNGPEEVPKKKKRIRKKVGDKDLLSKAWLRKNAECWNRPPSLFGHNGAVPTVTTKPAREGAPDGKFAFRRRRNCGYRAPIIFTPTVIQAVPATPSASSATAATKPAEVTPPQSSRFYETFVPVANGAMRSIGLVRRRCGRGGRVLFDRMPRNADEERLSTDPWAEYCVADNSRTFRARQTSLGTEEESDDQSPRSLYFARSDRCRFNDDEREREWASRYQPTDWKDIAEDEPSPPTVKKFNGTIASTSSHSEPVKLEEKGDNDDNSEVERMDVDGQEDEAQITVTSTKDEDVPEEEEEDGDDRKNEDDMDVDQEKKVKKPEQSNTIQVEKFRHIMTLKPLQEHSPPLHSHSGNGRAGREEPTPLPAKMSATVSETEDWREPSGSPSESNSSTEWGMMPYIGQQEHQTAAAVVIAYQQKKKLMNVVVEEDESVDDEDQHHQETKDRDHAIKESMSTVTMLENRAAKTYMMPSM